MKIPELFHPKNARSGNLEDYSTGTTPFVSNSNLNNGVVRFIQADDPAEVIEAPCLAVNGFGFATVQLQPFVGAGNGGVHIIALHPKHPMTVTELAYYAAQINRASWRFSYGRRAIERRLLQVDLVPFGLSAQESQRFLAQFSSSVRSSLRTVVR